jgi:hypothetical protein
MLEFPASKVVSSVKPQSTLEALLKFSVSKVGLPQGAPVDMPKICELGVAASVKPHTQMLEHS